MRDRDRGPRTAVALAPATAPHWLPAGRAGIIAKPVTMGDSYDVALRDFGLLVAALAFATLAFDRRRVQRDSPPTATVGEALPLVRRRAGLRDRSRAATDPRPETEAATPASRWLTGRHPWDPPGRGLWSGHDGPAGSTALGSGRVLPRALTRAVRRGPACPSPQRRGPRHQGARRPASQRRPGPADPVLTSHPPVTPVWRRLSFAYAPTRPPKGR
ncbi:hypothetical protein EKO23_15620 [Nocardioides guangzhouensis]|uniref:Uncharacterized protein n=1 Tax=Nocardioides guangzhouensis TaxID=2497878 RepID=A0A4Q4Z966_9ACTN|nr:hypothetical protein EKO23_15620 [Nocardioides guangzhouensis]